MIGKDRFKTAMDEIEALTGQAIGKEQRIAIYKRVQGQDERDFTKACEDEAFLSEASRYKFSYPLLKGYIERHRSQRFEQEAQTAKRAAQEAYKTMLQDEKTPQEVKDFLRGFGNIEIKNRLKDARRKGHV